VYGPSGSTENKQLLDIKAKKHKNGETWCQHSHNVPVLNCVTRKLSLQCPSTTVIKRQLSVFFLRYVI